LFVAADIWTASAAIAQVTPASPKSPSLILRSVSGRDLHEFYYAPCHGRDGAGGPVARSLSGPVSDLRLLTQRNGGTFPRAPVEASVAHGSRAPAVAADGTTDMPIWGPIFSGLDPSSEVMMAVRIANVVDYLDVLQKKAPRGFGVMGSSCGESDGADARGDDPPSAFDDLHWLPHRDPARPQPMSADDRSNERRRRRLEEEPPAFDERLRSPPERLDVILRVASVDHTEGARRQRAQVDFAMPLGSFIRNDRIEHIAGDYGFGSIALAH